MASLIKKDHDLLHLACAMQFSGGCGPYRYGQYLRYEKLRRLGLLRFWRRRSRRWDWCQYTITMRGQSYVENLPDV